MNSTRRLNLIETLKKNTDLNTGYLKTSNNDLKELAYLFSFLDIANPGLGFLLRKGAEYYLN